MAPQGTKRSLSEEFDGSARQKSPKRPRIEPDGAMRSAQGYVPIETLLRFSTTGDMLNTTQHQPSTAAEEIQEDRPRTAAAHTVFHIRELLEMILLRDECDVADVLCFQRAGRFARDTINGSRRLQRKLFLEPDLKRSMNDLVINETALNYLDWAVKHQQNESFSCTDPPKARREDLGQSWAKMYLTQPPLPRMKLLRYNNPMSSFRVKIHKQKIWDILNGMQRTVPRKERILKRMKRLLGTTKWNSAHDVLDEDEEDEAVRWFLTDGAAEAFGVSKFDDDDEDVYEDDVNLEEEEEEVEELEEDLDKGSVSGFQ
ncbi:Hypothetical predicted protein [Lecanosticta acicola]|uniref:Uncharacterized protein n=1 Tax=Lecanosticta acicola TaxID=111012 RepID=A0AAI9EA25_9PEZI|nr:Hypothetical predicted protein [Lecanosticta acicola]